MKFFFFLSLALSLSNGSLFFFSSVFAMEIETADIMVSGMSITPLGSDSELRVAREEEIARFRFRNGSENHRRMILKQVTFKNYGKSDLTRSLENPFITMNGKIVATKFNTEKKYITFVFDDNTVVEAGDNKIFSVKSVIAYARTGDTLQLGIAREEDFEVREMGSGFQVGFTAPIYFKTHTLRSGDLSFLRDWRSQAQKAERKFLQSRVRTLRPSAVHVFE